MINLQYLIRNHYRKNSRKAVSPVISTIIIVAIAIAISIAVALYLTGVTGTFTKLERLDVTSAYADTATGTPLAYPIQMTVKNSGTSPLTIDRLLINGKPTTISVTYGTTTVSLDGSGAANNIISMSQGDYGTITFSLSASTYKSGQSMELTFHTASGKEYPKVVVLP